MGEAGAAREDDGGGNFGAYTSIETDDAIIGEACAGAGVAFGLVTEREPRVSRRAR